MDDHQVREAALRLAIESSGKVSEDNGLVSLNGPAKPTYPDLVGLLERAEKFEVYLRGPVVVTQPTEDQPGRVATWRDRHGLE